MITTTFNRLSLSALTCACAAVLLTACGGGGSGSDATQAASGTTSTSTFASESGVNTNTDTKAASTPDSANSAPDSAASASASTSTSAGEGTGSSAGTTAGTTAGTSAVAGSSGASDSAKMAEAAASPVPFGQNAADYALTFSEEFNSWNSNLWNDTIWYEQPNATKNYTVEDGKLKIWPQRDASGKFFNRTIDTDGKYYQTYGYFEMEAKLPKGKGTWPAFWLFNHIGSRRPEMDIMEAYAGGEGWGYTDSSGTAIPTAFAATVWKGDTEGQQVGFKMVQSGVDLSSTWHKYAVKWEPNKQTYYFDGKEILVVNTPMTDPMYIMLDLWYGSAAGTPDNSTPQGKTNSYEINYVRAWKFK